MKQIEIVANDRISARRYTKYRIDAIVERDGEKRYTCTRTEYDYLSSIKDYHSLVTIDKLTEMIDMERDAGCRINVFMTKSVYSNFRVFCDSTRFRDDFVEWGVKRGWVFREIDDNTCSMVLKVLKF